MFWYPQLVTIQDLIERLEITEEEEEEVYYYEIKTETYEKPKRTRKFYKN